MSSRSPARRSFPFLALLTLLAIGLPSVGAAQQPVPGACHVYEGDAVSLLGKIRLQVFPGPPNFKNIYRGDEATYEFVLDLDTPVCLKAAPEREEGALPALADVRRVQALLPSHLPIEAELLGRLGEPVWLHGKLVPPSSPFHFLPVLVKAQRMTPVLFDRPVVPEVPVGAITTGE